MAISDALGGTFNEFADLIREGIATTGEPFEVTREGATHQVRGMRNREKGGRSYIGFLPGDDVKEGDHLRGTVSGDELWVVAVESHILEGKVLQVKAYYETAWQRARRERAKPAGPTFNISNAVGSVIGTQANAAVNFSVDWRELAHQIDERGGAEQLELQELVAAVRRLVEKRETTHAGGLKRFSSVMERHSWITGAIAQALLAWAVGR